MDISRERTTTTTLPLGRYEVDPTRSTIRFRTRHLFGLGKVAGTFAVRSGSVEVAEPLSASRVTAEVDAASFHTGIAARDHTVRSATFLDVDRHPVITFVSERVDEDALSGRLTVRGTSGPVTLAVQEAVATPDGFRVVATTRLDRFELGVTGSRGMTGRFLDLTVEVECVRR
ncbi:YceI family protein [Micromonospora endolithica]|uniref:YceI family protein n=1 Tax=Micromonospora endolithica TaxID=230091 RepID=A0A3A9ZHG3_9ACTN|nr:YceI family protein [Micromonospora endolithica]RKN47798.1 YceI family protein [Micromonospora endolithica]TWJ21480.1 polyisoprenoid-binding protein YceI [Micromonospora endolithica]